MGMAGVRIWAVGGVGEAFNATTNVTGYYGFNLLPGDYIVVARLDGYSFTSSSARITARSGLQSQRITGCATCFAVSSVTGGTTGYLGGTASPAAPTPAVQCAPVRVWIPVRSGASLEERGEGPQQALGGPREESWIRLLLDISLLNIISSSFVEDTML